MCQATRRVSREGERERMSDCVESATTHVWQPLGSLGVWYAHSLKQAVCNYMYIVASLCMYTVCSKTMFCEIISENATPSEMPP